MATNLLASESALTGQTMPTTIYNSIPAIRFGINPTSYTSPLLGDKEDFFAAETANILRFPSSHKVNTTSKKLRRIVFHVLFLLYQSPVPKPFAPTVTNLQLKLQRLEKRESESAVRLNV
jgi:hypothetical protein